MNKTIEHLNADCTCITLDRDALCRAMEQAVGDPDFCQDLAATHSHLLSPQPLFLSAEHVERMQAIILAIEAVAGLSPYRSAVLATAPEIARYQPGPIGVFMGYDFHLGPNGPKLIEINTNAGGALINAHLLQAQRACCSEMAVSAATHVDLKVLCDGFMSSFESEWRREGRTAALASIAIVDRTPKGQYLYPEFVLFQRLFEAHGLVAVIAAPEELAHYDGAVWHAGRRIDLVYNRLTDFDLSQQESHALRTAYLVGDVVVTPNPRSHALFANKRNLAVLTNETLLREWGVGDDLISTLLASIP